MNLTKTFESPFTTQFVERFSDENLPVASSPDAKLVGFLNLREGWYNGRGEPISKVAFRIARKLLAVATGDWIEATDVFPRPDGGITLALYFLNSDIAFNIKPSGVIDVDSETDENFPIVKELSEVHAFFIIQGLQQWNWSSSFTSRNTMGISNHHGFERLVSNDPGTGQVFRFLRSSVLKQQQVPYVLMPGLSIAK